MSFAARVAARVAPHRVPLPAALLRATCLAAAALCLPAAHAGEAYVKVGLPGAVVGYAHAVNQQLGLRVDAGTTGSMTRDRSESGIDYQVKFKYNRVGLFGDYFPFGGRFRLTGGLTINDTALTLKSKFDGVTPVTIGDSPITPQADDFFEAKVKIPRITPYIGIGWGHHAAERGFGFVADVGVSIGRAKVSIRENLTENYPGLITQADVDAETKELKDNVGKVRLLPHVAVGMSYRY